MQEHFNHVVGIAWLDGRPVVSEGGDCDFTPAQCPYADLSFPSGYVDDAKEVLQAYHKTMTNNVGTLMLVWALGAHLKAWLGFWPHLIVTGGKSVGKTTFLSSLNRSVGLSTFGPQGLNSEYRQLCSVSNTLHPVVWEELCCLPVRSIETAAALLQESFMHSKVVRGQARKERLVCAPVLVMDEDAPLRHLDRKIVRLQIDGERGPIIPRSLVPFPVAEWLNFLINQRESFVEKLYENCVSFAIDRCEDNCEEAQARRIVRNYAALLMAWDLIEEFCGKSRNTHFSFSDDLMARMNRHLADSRP